MNIVQWNPWREMETFSDRINRFFDDPLFPAFLSGEGTGLVDWNPVVDIYDHDDKIVIQAELPGMEKKDMHVELKGRVITLSGERSQEKDVKEENFLQKERVYGKFSRSFSLAEGLDPDKIEADFRDGVLKIEIPKPEAKKPKKIAVH
jgi:HSP20 family protein